MQNNKNVCRFCLKLAQYENVEFISEVTNKMLVSLLIKLDLNVSEDPVVCKICLGIFNEIYAFKLNCLYSEDIISAHFQSNRKVSLRDILIELENEPESIIAKDVVVCRFCIKIPPNGSYLSLNETGEEISHCRHMIQMQLPEINLNVIEAFIICDACHVLLTNYFSFAKSCMDVEQKIKTYCELQGSIVKEQVDLLCVLQFTENKALDHENSFNGELVVEQEENLVHTKMEKFEKDNFSEDQFTDGSSTEIYIKEEEVEIKLEDYQIRVEIGQPDPLDISDSPKKTTSRKQKQGIKKLGKTKLCPKCPYSSKYITAIKRHMRSHSHGKLLKCCLCPFAADNLFSMRTHMTSHKGPNNKFSCTECPYETHLYQRLDQHFIKHKDKSEVEMLKCPLCPYKNKNRANLRRHRQLEHDENIKIYQCKECSWSTKYRASHAHHQLLHKMVPSDGSPFSCDQCSYTTNAKVYLLKHKSENHMGPRFMLQCTQCDYCTRSRSSWHAHKNTHDPTKPKFKCNQCDYSSFLQSGLNQHLVTHMDLGETTVFYCANCDFKSKYKRSLSGHMKRCSKKKDDTDARVMFQCNQCDFHTKSRRFLRLHEKKHDPIKRKFKCDQCEYSTDRRSRLSEHRVAHMELGETIVYYCATCDFKSKYKKSLSDHVKRCPKEKYDRDSTVML